MIGTFVIFTLISLNYFFRIHTDAQKKKNKQQLYLFIEFLSIHSRRRVYILSCSYIDRKSRTEKHQQTQKKTHKRICRKPHQENQILLLNFEIKNNEIKEKQVVFLFCNTMARHWFLLSAVSI